MSNSVHLDMTNALEQYFRKLTNSWREAENSLPKACWVKESGKGVYVGEPDENEWIRWNPIKKTTVTELDVFEEFFDKQLHPTILAYFNTWWFAALEGRFDHYSLTLEPVLPGIELKATLMNLRGYSSAHEIDARYLPIGMDMNGGIVLVDNIAGEVKIEDFERGSREVIAKDLIDLIGQLQP